MEISSSGSGEGSGWVTAPGLLYSRVFSTSDNVQYDNHLGMALELSRSGATPIAPFAQATVKAVEPFAESKSDWEFHYRLMEAIQKRARARGEADFVDRWGGERSLENALDDFSYKGFISAEDPEPLLKASLFVTSNLGGVGWDELKEKGSARHTGLGRNPIAITNATDVGPAETITANTWHTNEKIPWSTLTRRMQFFIDHEFYLELGE